MARREGKCDEKLIAYVLPHKLVSFSRTRVMVQSYNYKKRSREVWQDGKVQ
jgi:hypothetical protein